MLERSKFPQNGTKKIIATWKALYTQPYTKSATYSKFAALNSFL